MADYDIGAAFEAIEEELIDSMMRNLSRHRAEEKEEGINWTQWQAEQLKYLEQYKKANQKKYAGKFRDINKQIDKALREAKQHGGTEQEQEILNAIKNGFKGFKRSSAAGMTGEFFKLNERKLEALIKATTNDMKRAETAILRMSNDQYRKAIYNAQVYANTGAGTYEKAVDMATKDMLYSGLNCIEYANGARHTLSDYADMAIRTASKRAYLQGEGEMRQEWGVTTVIMDKRLNPCPLCLPWVGKVLIDDVWSGGSKDGKSPVTGLKYPLMSTAIEGGLYHPRCKDSHTTYFEGISTPPTGSKYTRDELDQLAEQQKQEARQQYAARQEKKYSRMERYSLDPANRQIYGTRAEEWKAEKIKYSTVSEPVQQIETSSDVIESTNEKATEAKIGSEKGKYSDRVMEVLDKYFGKSVAKATNSDIIKLQINLFDKSDPLFLDALSIEEIDGFEDICMHGNPSCVQKVIDGKAVNMDVDTFIKYLKEKTNYAGGNIRLASCSTGKGDESFAQQLSRKLGVRVMAPDDDLYYAPNEGTMFVGSSYTNKGKWRIFNNGVEE